MHGSRYKTNSLEERFWEKVNKTNTCWNWNHIVKNKRYGQLRVGSKMEKAHRVSWKLHFGDIPAGLYVRHICDNTKCVNPEHLILGTQKDNMQDMISRDRQSKGVHRPNAKLTETDVVSIRRLYDTGLYTYAQLAKTYKLPISTRSSSTIRSIVKCKTWKHIL